MKLNKTMTAIIIAGSIGIAAHFTPLYAGSGNYCEGGAHGPGHFSMKEGHGPMQKNPEKMIHMMSHSLDLTDEQRDQLYAKLDEYRPQLTEARNAIHDGMIRLHEIDTGNENYMSSLDQLADEQGRLIANMIKLHAGMHVELEKLLTEEQKSKLDEMKQRHGRHHQGKRGHG